MILTPAIKGQLTKAVNSFKSADLALFNNRVAAFKLVRAIFARHMPKEQAKHATRKYLAQIA